MKQIHQNMSTGETRLIDVPVPQYGNTDVLIQSSCSLISSGMERMLVEFSKGSLLAKARALPISAQSPFRQLLTVQISKSFADFSPKPFSAINGNQNHCSCAASFDTSWDV